MERRRIFEHAPTGGLQGHGSGAAPALLSDAAFPRLELYGPGARGPYTMTEGAGPALIHIRPGNLELNRGRPAAARNSTTGRRAGPGCGPEGFWGQGRARVMGVARGGTRTVVGAPDSWIKVVKWPGLPVLLAIAS
jgi:hypothetical protein